MTTGLDINTAKGREAADRQDEAIAAMIRINPKYFFVKTVTDGEYASAVVDGFFCDGEGIRICCEVKSRDATVEKFFGEWEGKWLVTWQKILDMRTICDLLRIPGYGILYLVPSRVLLVKQIVTRKGFLADTCEVRQTRTQATVNGGVAYRENAYVNMNDAKRYTVNLAGLGAQQQTKE